MEEALERQAELLSRIQMMAGSTNIEANWIHWTLFDWLLTRAIMCLQPHLIFPPPNKCALIILITGAALLLNLSFPEELLHSLDWGVNPSFSLVWGPHDIFGEGFWAPSRRQRGIKWVCEYIVIIQILMVLMFNPYPMTSKIYLKHDFFPLEVPRVNRSPAILWRKLWFSIIWFPRRARLVSKFEPGVLCSV